MALAFEWDETKEFSNRQKHGVGFDEAKTVFRNKLHDRFKWVDEQLAGKQFLLGEQFSVADAYLFTVSNWGQLVGVDLSGYPNLVAYRARVGSRPAVQEAMKAEGLVK